MADEGKLIDIVTYGSVSDFFKDLDAKLVEMRSKLGELLRRLEGAKAKAEVLVRLESLLAETASGAKIGGTEISLGTAKAVVNPTPKQEFDILVDVVRSLQNRIVAMERVRKEVEPLAKLGDLELKLEVVYENGLPTRIMIRM
ncbi:MAG: hypothetical protein F7C37_05680 [Desulfurococcales archaeon]|nr:hypothetical protein [Desulfurococcales archaeon]MCE4622608.1 hypothetical protein [Desulfurococcales archaeon]NOZ30750.1 hypothetical protein [Thermoproteota archaeon]